ncbi:hypothetical protein B4092_5018 [Bacillus licheniformis]|nr:hypothetical protein B4092_5018 [Bacillus licheniformis]
MAKKNSQQSARDPEERRAATLTGKRKSVLNSPSYILLPIL